jgi:hypothetical protein
MSLTQQIEEHVSTVFLQTDHFAESFTYSRGATSTTMTFIRDDSAAISDNGSGLVTEISLVEFVGEYASMGSFGDPQKFDRLTNVTGTFEVQPVSDKCFYVSSGMIHIHAKQVHS